MGPDYIALGVPFFFLLIAIEAMVGRRKGMRVYRLADTVANLGCGVVQRMALLFYGGAFGFCYVWIYRHARVIDFSRWPATAWIVGFLGVDLLYYGWHRASHRVNLLWAGHVVHHQSEDFNLGVALRQSVLTPITYFPFSLTLAVVGIPPPVAAVCGAINTLYQFWIHTETVGRLGPLEAFLNTPSHHRAHHGRDLAYLDRNYGAVLIVWDRLFGTFVLERQRPRYGITTPLGSFNPLWAQVQYLFELARLSRGAGTWRDRFTVWLESPERTAARIVAVEPAPTPTSPGASDAAALPLAAPVLGVPAPPCAEERAEARAEARAQKYQVVVPSGARRKAIVNLTVAILVALALMSWHTALPPLGRSAAVLLVVATLATTSGLVEHKPWVRSLDVLRGFLLAGATALWAIGV